MEQEELKEELRSFMNEMIDAQHSFGWVCFIEGIMWARRTEDPIIRAQLAECERVGIAYKKLYESLGK
jgi:hypothetical protein